MGRQSPMEMVATTFIITALYDVVLQLYVKEMLPDPFGVRGSDWLQSLVPYFKAHTPLAAALIAGFVGAVTQPVISQFADTSDPIKFLATTFIVSGLIGFVMKASKLFPILDSTYYKTLGSKRAFLTDAYSGIVVNVTYLILQRIGVI